MAKAGCLYGVELWGWRRRQIVERIKGRIMKMAMGLNSNTPDYLHMESGSRGKKFGGRGKKKSGKLCCEDPRNERR